MKKHILELKHFRVRPQMVVGMDKKFLLVFLFITNNSYDILLDKNMRCCLDTICIIVIYAIGKCFL